jgi:adenosylcobinamide-GDP ribazoletransferase
MKDIIAAFMFFTRLPLWRVCKVPADSFKRIVAYWPLTGLLTGALMTTVYLLAIYLNFHVITAVILAFASRILFTGALHEDGLADFLDGFGGGHSRNQVLSIMKDSHIGSYGVLGLILYTLLWISTMFMLMQQFKGNEYIVFFTCDVWSKCCASQIINLLPYVRKEEDSKIKLIYDIMSPGSFIFGFMTGMLPIAYLIFLTISGFYALTLLISSFAPLMTMWLLSLYMKRRIHGYTGDCCGATFLLCELSYMLILNCLWKFI